ncbi:MAG: hypothetical protein HYZ42_18990, partial [Bacteroidetes bacterium]|nr:hypothetical protein [Bacteroidota bacterium]
MEQLDNIFKRLSTDEMQPSQKVWEAVHANQQKKRNRLFWWMGSGALLLAICFYVLYPNSRTSNSSLNQTDTNPLAVRDIPNQKSVKVSNKNLNISNQSTEVIRPTFTSQTSAKHTAFSAIRHTTNKNRISSKHITASDNINANKEAVNEDKKKVNISTNTEKKEMEQPETSAYMTEAPVASANDSFNIPNKEDYVEKKLVSPVKKKVEKSPYKKYINVSTLMAKTYRKLSTDNQAFESYKDLRNLNEISSNQVGIKVELGIVFNKHFSFEGGLMYLPNKISSNYTWQNVKSTEVFDSTIN